eukprot:scaffold7808_cov184-Amphora_coffeaeformis.AAC.25
MDIFGGLMRNGRATFQGFRQGLTMRDGGFTLRGDGCVVSCLLGCCRRVLVLRGGRILLGTILLCHFLEHHPGSRSINTILGVCWRTFFHTFRQASHDGRQGQVFHGLSKGHLVFNFRRDGTTPRNVKMAVFCLGGVARVIVQFGQDGRKGLHLIMRGWNLQERGLNVILRRFALKGARCCTVRVR